MTGLFKFQRTKSIDLQPRELCPTAAGRICRKGYTCFDVFPAEESWVPRNKAICVQTGAYLAPNETFRECTPPRCMEYMLVEPKIRQQQTSNLLNSDFAGEARHSNPSHCLAFFNDIPDYNDTHYASGDARMVADIWNYIVQFFKGEEQPYPIERFFVEGEIPDKPNRTAAGPLTIIRYCRSTSKSIPTQHPILAPALRT